MPPDRITWVPPDGGWGWVIVVCSVLLHMHTVGVIFGLSVMYVSWLETFGVGRGITSWIISLTMAITFGLAPIPAAFANRYGFRVVVIVGGLLSSTGYTLTYFATSVTYMIVTIGFIAGLGSCFGYLSAVAVVSDYFDKRRPLAIGIAATGSGIGAFVFGPLLDYLINVYGWRGTILIIGAYSLHICVYGLLLRPLKTITVIEEICIEATDSYEEGEKQSLLLFEKNVTVNVDEDANEDLSKTPSIVINDGKVSSMTTDHSTVHVLESPLKKKEPFLAHEVTNTQHSETVSNLGNVDEVHELRNSRISMHSWQGKAFKQHSNARPYSSLRDLDSIAKVYDRRKIMSSYLNRRKSMDAYFASRMKHLDRILLMGFLPKQLFQSIHDLEDTNVLKEEEIDDCELCSEHGNDGNSHTLLSKIKKAIVLSFHANRDLLKDPIFLQFGISNLITNLSFITPVMYLVDRADDEGLGKSIGSILISLSGVGGIFGRVFFGAVTYRLFQDRLLTYIVVLSLAGIFTMLSPLCGSNVYLHCIYAALIGCLLGGYSTLVAVVTTDLMGLTKASESFGLLLTFMGVATLIGPPFAGLLFDWTRSYKVTYILFGFFLVSSVLMLVPAYFIKRRKNKREKNLEEKKNKILKRDKETDI